MATILGIIFFISCCIFIVLSNITENPKFIIGTSVSFILTILCIILSNKKEPSKLYQEKVEAVEKTNKELEKFLIDYPEFREK